MKHILEIALITVAALVVIGAIFIVVRRHRQPKNLKTDSFQEEWQKLQKKLCDKTKWAEAVKDADNLLEKALKKKRINGHNMGERMVKAQRLFTDNDGVWFGHKLRNKIDDKPKTKLKEAEVKQALIGIRQALKDVGALPDVKPRTTK
jgi:hypothetical protein